MYRGNLVTDTGTTAHWLGIWYHTQAGGVPSDWLVVGPSQFPAPFHVIVCNGLSGTCPSTPPCITDMECAVGGSPGKPPPSLVLLRPKESYETPVWIYPSWKVMVLDFATLAIRPTLWKSPIRTFIAPWSQSGSLDPMMMSSAKNMLIILPTNIPNPSWMADLFSTVSKRQCRPRCTLTHLRV